MLSRAAEVRLVASRQALSWLTRYGTSTSCLAGTEKLLLTKDGASGCALSVKGCAVRLARACTVNLACGDAKQHTGGAHPPCVHSAVSAARFGGAL